PWSKPRNALSRTPRRLFTSKATLTRSATSIDRVCRVGFYGVSDHGTHARVTQEPGMESRRSCRGQELWDGGPRTTIERPSVQRLLVRRWLRRRRRDLAAGDGRTAAAPALPEKPASGLVNDQGLVGVGAAPQKGFVAVLGPVGEHRRRREPVDLPGAH